MTRSLLPLPLLAGCALFAAGQVHADTFLAQALHPEVLQGQSLEQRLTRLAPGADPKVLSLAANALACADPDARRLAVIDYSLPSTEPRLWVFDLPRNELMFEELVSHGRGSGDAMATTFSNVPESYQSSLGLFRTMNTYYGRNGYSLRLEGLEAGVNDLAYQRAIVIHGADYVSESFIEQTGRLGRSHGCPAVRQEVTYPLIDSIKEEQYLFVYYPDPEWLEGSAFLACDRDDRQLAMR
ncbi:murein L,D-transpeptidase catalytic domain family protein [Halomonas alkalicola]|uniref:Murein L,D-transpeptidase catalytic domain family protein n=1 Tax=Halomonas alkalicola TaxID=1930622 RepID=A0ABY9H8C0_9GAMM|nr:murein L,D-transpeptidase catalytic domain family protein [Halomonas alkalicola]WLI74443.1 murein L,D-transpeptidase catalytic domain family protein [Halomonas alkalicola]